MKIITAIFDAAECPLVTLREAARCERESGDGSFSVEVNEVVINASGDYKLTFACGEQHQVMRLIGCVAALGHAGLIEVKEG
ncbi:hypothetical protein SAMN04488503_2255 [Humidesulfovibrio mexicanus]|uniref:Uncharacterized protein n=1 Tax=Humidesulfovibrio mexicanus TaxID=147047 RepID=A0A239AXN2_9BACT|nr:hypothetical protein [Humidesulfovibrio mexicanus]SNR99738.1 hypothetical protein SAMN04488503_2255 [Humidesulfovibrio mexicanus]